MTEAEYRCPHDGGFCHHGCARRLGPTDCDRKRHGMSLTTPWKGFPVAGNQPVLGMSAKEAVRLLGQAKQHMTNIPDGHTPWPETVQVVPAGEAEKDSDGLPLGYAEGPPAGTRVLDEEQWSL